MTLTADRSQCDFHGKLVFIFGCPRSGTTWLQLLLYQHPLVASSQETQLFSHYLNHLANSWKREEDDKAYRRNVGLKDREPALARAVYRRRREVGLMGALSQAEFEQLMRDFALAIFGRIGASRPQAKVLVEKTPQHTYQKDLILRVLPNAQFIHLVRDPRGVVASLRQAKRLCGFNWAPTNVVSGAKYWRASVQAAQGFSQAKPNYKEVFYEQLHADGPALLQQLLTWLELDTDLEFCERAFAHCSIENLREASEKVAAPWSLKDEPANFYRRGATNGWRDELSKGEIRAVEYIAGDLMEGFGYRRSCARTSGKPLRVSIHDALERSGHGAVNAVAAISPRLVRGICDA